MKSDRRRAAPRSSRRGLAGLIPTALLALLAGCAQQEPAPEPAAPAPVVEEAPPEEESLTVAGVGDIMLGTDYPQNILPDDDGVEFLAAVTPLLRSTDIAFGNLEGTLMDGGDPVKQCERPTSCYVFRTPTHYAAHLAEAGFDVLSLANNHAHDFGEEGRESTMLALDAHDIRHSGREGDVASWTVRGIRVALIAFAPNIGAHMLNDYARAQQFVSQLAATHEVVIVSFHGGAEGLEASELPFAEEVFHGEARGDVVRFSHGVIDAGADLVLGHGPHVPRALELYRDRLIAYSLGNFATYYGIAVDDVKGLAPVLIARVARDGRFLEGRIASMIQVRPGGPQPDPHQHALQIMRALTEKAFGLEELQFFADGTIRAPASMP